MNGFCSTLRYLVVVNDPSLICTLPCVSRSIWFCTVSVIRRRVLTLKVVCQSVSVLCFLFLLFLHTSTCTSIMLHVHVLTTALFIFYLNAEYFFSMLKAGAMVFNANISVILWRSVPGENH